MLQDGLLKVIPATFMSFRAIAGIQKVFILQTNKRKKYWIPSQVGDDIGVVFGDDSYSPSS
ncbi:MAG TPA: hypothetical protein PK455_04455 [Caldisericia bacterium]|nr:hypothetical protein [Caldisericia bacterium]